MDNVVVTRNSRISVLQREGDLWQLSIKNVKPSDQGWYMCQTNTDPMESQMGYLEVTGKQAALSMHVLKVNRVFLSEIIQIL